MEDTKIAVVIKWKTLKRDTIERMAARFGFVPYVSVTRRTGAMIKREDLELLEECERRGLIEITK